MGDYDWMTDPKFKEKITSRVSSSAGSYGMENYRTSINDWITNKISDNSKRHVLTETAKTASERRGENEALRSVGILMKYACEEASNENRKLVTLEDVEKAYSAHYCSFWPIC